MRRLWGCADGGWNHEVGELTVTQLVGGDPVAFVGRVRILAHDERGIILTIADGGVGRFGVMGVILTPNQF